MLRPRTTIIASTDLELPGGWGETLRHPAGMLLGLEPGQEATISRFDMYDDPIPVPVLRLRGEQDEAGKREYSIMHLGLDGLTRQKVPEYHFTGSEPYRLDDSTVRIGRDKAEMPYWFLLGP